MPQNLAPSKTVLANNNVSDDPNIQAGINIAQKENPNLAPVSMYGPVSNLLQPNSQGYTSPGGTIYLNPKQLQGMTPEDIADTVTHENTHAQQMQRTGGGALMQFFREMMTGSTPYGQRPDEIEAFQAEEKRRNMMGRTQTAYPSFFNPGQYVVPLDQNLPADKPVVKK